MKTISRQDLQRALEGDSPPALVDVLSPKQFDEFHLPGAINVPNGDEFEQAIVRAVPDKQREVVVYCWDEDCSASPKAARQMEALGYEHVLDYEAGKKDWREAGLPIA
jgi:rhodanese-related sulfurtransferase